MGRGNPDTVSKKSEVMKEKTPMIYLVHYICVKILKKYIWSGSVGEKYNLSQDIVLKIV